MGKSLLLGVGGPLKISGGSAGTIIQNGTTVSNLVGVTGILPAMSWLQNDLVCVAVAGGPNGGVVITGASGGGGALNTWFRMYDGGAGGSSGVHSGLNQATDGTGNDIDIWCATANGPGTAQVITISGAPFPILVGFVLTGAKNSVQHGSGSPAVDAITQSSPNSPASITPAPVVTTQTSQVLLVAAQSNSSTFSGFPSGYSTIVSTSVNSGTAQTGFYIGLQTTPHSGSGTITPGDFSSGAYSFACIDTIALAPT